MASVDEGLQQRQAFIVSHMNEEHQDSLLAYAMHYAKLTSAVSATLDKVSSKGMTLKVQLPGSDVPTIAEVPFTRPMETAGDLRKIVVEMHHEAYGALGVAFRLMHGYYTSAARQTWHHMKKSHKIAAVIFASAAVVGIGWVVMLLKKRQASQASVQAPAACCSKKP
mmetsp:Transcript_23449/g.70444  ORF Transcript_23449/g.70444 Transcript_23449/m.70444 type:complete len:167 (-) Transcript_23449:99-599(-)